MSTDEPIRDDEPGELETGDSASSSAAAHAAASDETTAALSDIEALPLAERAPGYQALADRLRIELEQSDPSRPSDSSRHTG
ncbi:hypothetical protein [Agromyces albus]|uniref:Uncharacterized protein n=1 Tax=Agromyces albus TaxID=205332 RepID=A0A4Q2KXL2_9MICO|nr:hypothetical protein [Agromyces albus]RXZ68612.1 hypothetical protein ESP51_13395 [Agromyces albus]